MEYIQRFSAFVSQWTFPLGANARLIPACVLSFMMYGSVTWLVKDEHVIKLERNDARMVRWMCNARPVDRITAEEHRNRLKLSSKGYLKDRLLQLFGHLERTEKMQNLQG